jgi:hypothetical protein
MRVAVYDKSPGPGLGQWGLKLSWVVGCWLFKLFGKIDAYYGAESWADALAWLTAQKKPLLHIQYWGHGSQGLVYLAGKYAHASTFAPLASSVTPESVIWFRTCSTFGGPAGYNFSQQLSGLLNCTVAGHTRIIGPLQGGLHTRKPFTPASWPVDEMELVAKSWLPVWARWGNNTVTCLSANIPKGW